MSTGQLLCGDDDSQEWKGLHEEEFIKQCITAIIEEICPEEKKGNLCSASLSASTRELKRWEPTFTISCKRNLKTLLFFSLALDEHNGIKDTPQLLIFICGVENTIFLAVQGACCTAKPQKHNNWQKHF